MYLILYNPLSKSGKNQKIINKAKKIISDMTEGYEEMDITSIGNLTDFINTIDPQKKVLVIGGDGTIHYLINYLYGREIRNEIYFFGAGTGNDFVRNVNFDSDFIPINGFFNNLPSITFKGVTEHFINGSGLGLDAYVCDCVNHGHGKSPIEFKINTIKAFLTTRKIDIELIVDGVSEAHKGVWLISIMNAPYQGGGMKFAPSASIDDEYIHICMVKKYSRFRLLMLFPKIFKGKHEKYVYVKKCKEVRILVKGGAFLQIDGEVVPKVEEVIIKR